jgi:Na+/proline symporter
MALALSVCIGFLIGATYGALVTIVDFAPQLAERFLVLQALTRGRERQFVAQLLVIAVMAFLFGLALNNPRLSWGFVALGTVAGGAVGWRLARRLLVRGAPHRG